MTLSWKPPTNDGGLPITNYIVEVKEPRRSTWSKCGDVSADKTIYTADKLLTDTDYYFRVTAVNDEGAGPGLESISPARPQKKKGLSYEVFTSFCMAFSSKPTSFSPHFLGSPYGAYIKKNFYCD